MNDSEILGLIEFGDPEAYLNELSEEDKKRLYYQQLMYNNDDKLNRKLKRAGYANGNANNLSDEDLVDIISTQKNLIAALNGLYGVIKDDETLGFGCDKEYYKERMEKVQSEMEALLDIAKKRGIIAPEVEETLLEINEEEKEPASAK